MCRWGCPGIDSTFMCKWCGTRYCRECLKGEYTGAMFEESRCRKCNQINCQGQKVEFVIAQTNPDEAKPKKEDKKGILNQSRSRSSSPSKGGSKGAKSSKPSKADKKSGKKSSKKSKGGKTKKKKKKKS